MTRLPSLNALRAFDAAGRHLSFSRAAEDLHVSAAAVGQQVRVLEDYLGARLFLRNNRAIELTAAGQALLPGVSAAFEQLTHAVEGFYRRSARRPLTVSIEPSFGARWLLTRLDGFREQHPGVEIRLDATVRVVDFNREAVDLAVRYGTGDYPDLRADHLFEERVFPVCSPRLIEGPHPLREPEDLRWHTLLHMDWNPDNPTWPDWEMWLRAAGVSGVDATAGIQFEHGSYELMLEAAEAGQGVALAGNVVGDDLRAGKLVRPFRTSVSQTYGYFVVSPKATADSPRIATFRDWLIAEARASEEANAEDEV